MGWRGRGRGRSGDSWPGSGPFSDLPPWQRPGWMYGRGAGWWLSAPYLRTIMPTIPTAPFTPTLTKEQEIQMLEQQMKVLQSQLDSIKKRMEELNR